MDPNLYQELGSMQSGAVTIYCNLRSIKISKNPIYHSKTKHFQFHLDYVCNGRTEENSSLIHPRYPTASRYIYKSLWHHDISNLQEVAIEHHRAYKAWKTLTLHLVTINCLQKPAHFFCSKAFEYCTSIANYHAQTLPPISVYIDKSRPRGAKQPKSNSSY